MAATHIRARRLVCHRRVERVKGQAMSYEYRNGQRLAPAVAYDFDRMAEAFHVETGLTLHVNDGGGLRLEWEQQQLWDDYQRFLNGGPWAPLAAHPDDPRAYHVETNPNGARALDLGDSGPAGVGVASGTGETHAWMLKNAHRFNFENEGMTFSRVEPWHKKWTGRDPWTTPHTPTHTPTHTPSIIEGKAIPMDEIYIAVKAGAGKPDDIYHIVPGVQAYKFRDEKDYRDWKNVIDTQRGINATRLMSPPDLANFRHKGQERWRLEALCKRYGVTL